MMQTLVDDLRLEIANAQDSRGYWLNKLKENPGGDMERRNVATWTGIVDGLTRSVHLVLRFSRVGA